MRYTDDLELKRKWSWVADRLTIKQFELCMGGDMTFKAKALRAKSVSKSKRVHRLCDRLIEACEELDKRSRLVLILGEGLIKRTSIAKLTALEGGAA